MKVSFYLFLFAGFAAINFMQTISRSAEPVFDFEIASTAGTTTIREVCFFGDLCTEEFLDYQKSLYAQQKQGLRHDMPAIFKIEVWRTHHQISDSISTYSNEAWFGEGAPLCVRYPGFKDVEDLIEFKLFVLLKTETGFKYIHLYTWSTTDALPLKGIGKDNVMDFAVGSCSPDADVIIPAYVPIK